MNRRHEPLDPEERALARLLADADSAEPSAELDARILAAARAPAPQAHAGTATPPAAAGGARHRRPRRWPLALGLAASVTLAVGVAWQLREPPPLPGQARVAMEAAGDAMAPAAPAAPQPVVQAPATETAAAASEAQAVAPMQEPVVDAVAKPAADADAAARAQEHEAAVAAAERRATQRGEKAERQAASAPPPELSLPPPPAPAADLGVFAETPAPEPRREALPGQTEDAARAREHEAAVAAAMQRSTQRSEKAARQAAPTAFPAPAPPLPPASAPAAATAATVRMDDAAPGELQRVSAPRASDAFAGQGANLDPDALARLEADARLPAAQWLQRIRGHRDRGEIPLARASLGRFAQAHPAVPLPEDLRPLLP